MVGEEDRMEQFTAVFQRDGDWWVAFIKELPGANTQGRTLDEARENLHDAVQMILEADRMRSRRESEEP